jgi:hypothetical protein
MSESSLYLLSQRLRLLARRDVLVSVNGDYVAGRIRRHFEAAFVRTSAMVDLVVDGDQLTAGDIAWLKRAQARVELLRPHVRALERQSI